MIDNVQLEIIAKHVCEIQSWEYVKKIGEGTYKETFQIIERESNFAALKIYRQDAMQERSIREIDAMQRCDHRCIAKLLFIGSVIYKSEEFHYVLEEFLAGGTLTNRICNLGLLDIPSTLLFGSQLIDAVGHIASLDLVHRDIKPDNILFRNSNEAVITDFGIVRNLHEESITQTWAPRGPGTYFFSAPEQLRNEKMFIDWRTDQFSLGILLAICTFDMHPYDLGFKNPGEIIQNVANRGPVSNEFIELSEKAGLNTLINMVRPWPAQRYRTSIDLYNAWSDQGRL